MFHYSYQPVQIYPDITTLNFILFLQNYVKGYFIDRITFVPYKSHIFNHETKKEISHQRLGFCF